VRKALADAVDDLRGAGLALDVPLGQVQYESRGAERIPIHGGPYALCVFNVISADWNPPRGYPDVVDGSSYVQVVRPTGGCPDAHTILTYSQSPDPTSRWFADQTRMYSRKQWVTFPFCDGQIATDAGLALTNLNGGYAGYAQTGTSARLLRRVAVRRTGRRALRVTILTGASTVVTVRVRRAGRTVAGRRVRTAAGRPRWVMLRGLPAATVRVEVIAASVAGGLPARWSSARLRLG
jgi:hypothetical protein